MAGRPRHLAQEFWAGRLHGCKEIRHQIPRWTQEPLTATRIAAIAGEAAPEAQFFPMLPLHNNK
jgi:hypothetical protein